MNKVLSNKWGRTPQGNEYGIRGTNTLNFIPLYNVSKDRKVTYGSFVCNHQQLKVELWRVILVVGRDKISYESDTGSPIASML